MKDKSSGGANLSEGLSSQMGFDAKKHAAQPTSNDRPSKRPMTSCGNGQKIKGR